MKKFYIRANQYDESLEQLLDEVDNLVYQCYDNYAYDDEFEGTFEDVYDNVTDHLDFLIEDMFDEDDPIVEAYKTGKGKLMDDIRDKVKSCYEDYDWEM